MNSKQLQCKCETLETLKDFYFVIHPELQDTELKGKLEAYCEIAREELKRALENEAKMQSISNQLDRELELLSMQTRFMPHDAAMKAMNEYWDKRLKDYPVEA